MISTFKRIVGSSNFLKLERFKKSLFPTKYDKEQLRFFNGQVNFYSSFIKQGNLCFDIGGNVGDKTKIFLELAANVIVAEPQQSCVEILKEKYADRAIILQTGIGAVEEIKEFYVSDNSQLSSFNANWVDDLKGTRFADNRVNSVEKIKIVTLDSLIETYGVPDFIKIDVEGHELEVLQGLNKAFRLLSFEYAVPEKLTDSINCLLLLKNKYPGLLCNYTVGNYPAEFCLKKWLSAEDMLQYIKHDDFSTTYAGDIFIKHPQY
jgi:FkbM family methyltransferase